MSFGGEAAGTGFRVPRQRKGMGEDLLKKTKPNQQKTRKKMQTLSEQQADQTELKNATSLFSQYY